MKRSHSRRDEEESEERYRKRRDHKESRHNGDQWGSRHRDEHRGSRRNDEHRSSRRDDGHRDSKRDDARRGGRREERRDRRYNDRDDPRDSDGEAGGKRDSPREEIGSRYYGEPDKARENPEDAKQKRTVDLLTSKTGGAYIPPAKLRMLQAEITDKSGAAYQRIAWEALKKSIHGYINKVNTSNIGIITRELLRENIVRGRGLLARSIIQAQAASPTFTPVYTALTSIINSKFPNIGELVLMRLVLQFRHGFRGTTSRCAYLQAPSLRIWLTSVWLTRLSPWRS